MCCLLLFWSACGRLFSNKTPRSSVWSGKSSQSELRAGDQARFPRILQIYSCAHIFANPAQNVFTKLRTLAKTFHMAVLLVYGRPDIVPTEERMRYDNLAYSQGCQLILFRPGDGKSARMHFNQWPDDERTIRIMDGEAGEYGPLAEAVVAGHKSVAALA